MSKAIPGCLSDLNCPPLYPVCGGGGAPNTCGCSANQECPGHDQVTYKFPCIKLSVAFLRSATYLTTTTASGAKGPPAGQVNKPRSNLDPGWACKVALAMQTARWIDLFVVLGLSTPVATITCAVVSWTRTATDSVQPWVPGSQRFVRIESVLRVAGDNRNGKPKTKLHNFQQIIVLVRTDESCVGWNVSCSAGMSSCSYCEAVQCADGTSDMRDPS